MQMMRLITLAMVGMVAGQARAATLVEHLEQAPKPVFKQGHTLLPLARWGWSMPYGVRVALCEDWGYALEFGGYLTMDSVTALAEEPDSDNARLVALTASDPDKYPLFVLTHRPLCGRDLANLPRELAPQFYVHDRDGQPILDGGKTNSWRCISPEAPDAIYEWAAEGTAAPVRKLRERAPIAMVLNGGEYGQSVFGHSGRYWEQDPKVMAAKDDRDWFDYLSERKGHHEGIVAKAVRAAVPDRRAYIWYHFAGEPSWAGWTWTHDYQYTRALSDLPSQSLYYLHFNSGWTGKNDLLSNFLCAVTLATARHGDALSYNWVAGGWKEGKISELDRYMGFLKCAYTAGMVGGVAGYFSYPEGLRRGEGDVGETPPVHLQQMMALGRVQALFSHVEEFLRDGVLLPGPLKHSNANAAALPACEFPTDDPTARVLVRKHDKQARWLATAWAADGGAREVTVEIPELGSVSLNARPAGSVYILRVASSVAYEPREVDSVLIDQDGMRPSLSAATRAAK